MPVQRKFRLRNADRLEWRTWGDESVVFNAASGDTHLLNLVERAGLKCLEAGPLDAAELAQRMARELEVPADAALAQYAARLIARLGDLGLLAAERLSTFAAERRST